MVKSVVNEIVLGIAAKIKATFKDKGNYPIYDDNQEQGVEKPCFFIKVLNGEEKRDTGLENRFYWDSLNIVIIGYTLDGNTEILNNMMDNLYELEYIELSDKSLIRAAKLYPKIEDGVLHFFVDYHLSIQKDNIRTVSMNDFKLSEEEKGNENN